MMHEWRGLDPEDGSDEPILADMEAARSAQGGVASTAARTGLTFGVVVGAIIDALHHPSGVVRSAAMDAVCAV